MTEFGVLQLEEVEKDRKTIHLKSNSMIRHINGFRPEDAGNVKNISSGGCVYSNFNQHQFPLSKWQVGDIPDLKETMSSVSIQFYLNAKIS